MRPCTRSSRAGLSLLEVMFALAILAIVLSGVAVSIGHLDRASARSDDDQLANDLLRMVMERVLSVEYEDINTLGHWSAGRFLHGPTPVGSDPVSYAHGLTMGDLRSRGLVHGETPFDDEEQYAARLFIEYFRAIDRAGDRGVMQSETETDADYRQRTASMRLDGNASYQLVDRSDIEQISDDPIVVRLVLVTRWRRYERMTALRGRVF